MNETQSFRQALDAESRRCLDAEMRLRASEESFERFVSMAAHNLREPLRDVSSFSQMLAESCAVPNDSEVRAFLERIQQGAVAMQSLLSDIVDYVAIDVDNATHSVTEMESVLRQSLLCTDNRIKERSALVTHDPLPLVCGDYDILTKLLHHLIRNAIQYCTVTTPQVHVSCKPGELDQVFSVKDNGPGIAPEFKDRIFEPFQRLHGREYPGSGLGLAFCKKAIEGHGGRIWMESTPGEGSTFYFSLPSAD